MGNAIAAQGPQATRFSVRLRDVHLPTPFSWAPLTSHSTAPSQSLGPVIALGSAGAMRCLPDSTLRRRSAPSPGALISMAKDTIANENYSQQDPMSGSPSGTAAHQLTVGTWRRQPRSSRSPEVRRARLESPAAPGRAPASQSHPRPSSLILPEPSGGQARRPRRPPLQGARRARSPPSGRLGSAGAARQ